MRSRSQRRLIELVISVAAALLFFVASDDVQASCYKPDQRLPNAQVREIKADPLRLLTQYPTGGIGMTSLIRDLVASDPATLVMALDLTVAANADQVSAIGTGLGEAALACAGSDGAFESEIRQMIASLGNELLNLAFAAAMGDQFLAGEADRRRWGADGCELIEWRIRRQQRCAKLPHLQSNGSEQLSYVEHWDGRRSCANNSGTPKCKSFGSLSAFVE